MSFRSVFRRSSTDQYRWSRAGRGDVRPTPYLGKHALPSDSNLLAITARRPAIIITHIHASRVEIPIVRTAGPPPVGSFLEAFGRRPCASRSHRGGAVIRNPSQKPRPAIGRGRG